jgi:nucleotide-binding universal stress UspA family protein
VEDTGQAQALLDKTVAIFSDAGITVSGQLQRSTVDKVADVLLEVASRENAGLIAVGSRGHGDVYGALFGSTAHKVIHRADVPVLVRRDTRPE